MCADFKTNIKSILSLTACPVISHGDSSFCSGSTPTSQEFHLAVSSIPRAKYCNTISYLHAISSPTVDKESSLSSSLLSSSATSSDVCETVVPPNSLMDLTCFTFNNLSSCNLHSMAALFSVSEGSTQAVVSCEAKKKQYAHVSTGERDHYTVSYLHRWQL